MNIVKFLKETFLDDRKAFGMYEIRWQLSSPIFIVLGMIIAQLPYWAIIIVSNIIGAAIFFPIDKLIMKKDKK